MATRMIDRNNMRGGAGVSAVVLLIAYVFGARWIAPIVAIALGLGAAFGLKRSPLGIAFKGIKQTFKLSIPVELEEEPPPRFAQLVGFVFTGAATLAFYAGHSTTAGWSLALIVAALQGLLAATGICVGCEVYNFGRRFKKVSVS